MSEFNEFELAYIKELINSEIIKLNNLLEKNIPVASRNYFEFNLEVYKKINEKIGGKEKCLKKKVQMKY